MAQELDQAVVIGASVSGLLAARVLAKHFDQVTVLERDALPPPGTPRKGVPQGNHLHVLLARGRDLLENFFPGLTEELAQCGATVGDLSETSRWFSGGAYTQNFRSGLISVQASRPLLEGLILQRVRALPNVTILEQHNVMGLLHDNGQVTGLRVEDRRGAAPSETVQRAALVVDAAGRGSRCLGWLEELGYPRPPEEQIKMNLAYTTRHFRRLPEHANGHNPIVCLNTAENKRAGVLQAIEGERWVATLSGFLGVAAPTDLQGYLEYARQLEAPDIYNVLRGAEPLDEGYTYKYPASQRRYFEKLTRFPAGMLVVGDALCSFNPIYGQGMTTAAVEADLLDQCLGAGGLDGLARRFFQNAGKQLDSPWQIAAGSDLAYPEVQGKRAPGSKLVGAYLERLLLASQTDTTLNLAFQRVTNLMDPPSALFHPKIVARVIQGRRGRPN